MASLLDILSWRNISQSIQKVETGIPDRLPSAFTTIKEDVLGDRTTYVKFYGQRQTPRRAEYGAPSRVRTLRPLDEQTVTLLHFPEHIKIRQELMLRLRNPNDLLAQQMAQQEIARHGRDFRTLFDNGRIGAITSMLANGKIWYDVDGNLLPSSSGTALTVDYNVGANNRNQLNGIIGTGWTDTSAPIIQQLENIRIQMRRNTGRVLKHAFYGKNIANYIFTNVTTKAYWVFNSQILSQFQANPGVVPNGFAGLEWHPFDDTFFEDQNESIQGFFGDDQITFTPEIDRNVYTMFEGSIAVPKSFGISDSLTAALEHFDIVYGLGGYAVPEIDPVGIKEVYFDTMLPMWKNPLDMFIADVTP